MNFNYQTVIKSALLIDPKYQRTEEVNAKLIEGIVSNFDQALFGVPVVARRKDGSMWVIDGQHRVLAVQKMSSISKIPVMIVDVKDAKHEADLFVGFNTKRTSVSAYGRFHAAVAAGHKMEMEINEFLLSIGMIPGPRSRKGRLTCIGEVISIWKKNKFYAKQSLTQLAGILAKDESPNLHLVRGLFCLAMETNGESLRDSFTHKFARIGQEELIVRAELRQYYKQPLEGALRLARIANLRSQDKLDVTQILHAIGSGEEVLSAA